MEAPDDSEAPKGLNRMSARKPDDKVPSWPKDTMYWRVKACAAMLNLHDFMTDGERRKVERRIENWKATAAPVTSKAPVATPQFYEPEEDT